MNKNYIASAARLAKRLHAHQVDKAGVDYFKGHLSTVAAMGTTWQEQVVGYLHDAAEDTPHDVAEVMALFEAEIGKPLPPRDHHAIATALQLLNHHATPNREAYIHAIGENALATAVKCHDLTHNMDLSRLAQPTEKDFQRLERYQKEYEYLSHCAQRHAATNHNATNR